MQRNVRPKKHLGQHFLTDEGIAQRIVGLLQAKPPELVVEIGPGKGVLTQYLVQGPQAVLAYEVDAESVAYLQTKLITPHLVVMQEDFLAASLPSQPQVWIGNLPYNISSPIFFKLLDHLQCRRMVAMVQREVGLRLAAGPGSKTYGILSVLLGYYYLVKYEFTVQPGSFFPPPNVHSGVLSLERRNAPPLVHENFVRVVKTAFGQRRKTLQNALKGLPLAVPTEWANLRAEQLPIASFVQLAALLKKTE